MYKFDDLIKIMETLRSKDGCPWDREQTHDTLLPYLLEETYEFIDSVKEKDYKNMEEELGDLLLQVLFHSQIARENKQFTIEEVINTISKKLIHRHPHVFGDRKEIQTADDVLKNWENFKKEEGKKRSSIIDGVPKSMPPIERAVKLQKKVAKVGFDWSEIKDVIKKVNEEWQELKEAIELNDRAKMEEELGDFLFSIVNLSRFLNIDPTIALHGTNKKFTKRFKRMEEMAKGENKSLENMNLKEMDYLWETAKKEERDVSI